MLDQAPCHLTAPVKLAFSQRPITSQYIPKRGTNLLQPADVGWMRPFKIEYFNTWQNWMINEPKSFTAAGNLRSPGYAKAITWISEVWASFDSHLLANSFDQCGITSSSVNDMHLQLRTFVNSSRFVDSLEPAGEEEIDSLFVAPHDADPQDELETTMETTSETESDQDQEREE